MKDCEGHCLLVRLEKDVPKRTKRRVGEWEIVRPGETTPMYCRDYDICFADIVYDRINNGEYQFASETGNIIDPCKKVRVLKLEWAIKQLGK